MTDVVKALTAVRLRDAAARGISGLWGKRRRKKKALETSVQVAEATIARTTVTEDDWVLCDVIDGPDTVIKSSPSAHPGLASPKRTVPVLLPRPSLPRPTVQETKAEGRAVNSGQDLPQVLGKQEVYYECQTGEALCTANTSIVGSYNCTHKDRFQGERFNCREVNDCRMDETLCTASTDASTVGGYNYSRNSGFQGDGFNCTKDFQGYKLSGVQIAGEDLEFSRGYYATVMLEYRGLKCTGKKLYPVHYEQGSVEETIRRFERECLLLAKLQHPNIVEFIGVYFQEGSRVPILVTEFLPITLARYINENSLIEEIKYSILRDVAHGLHYLHCHAPPIVHRDVSALNVLLTFDMTAKISNLGVARILDLTPTQMSRMANTPGTSAYTPPEAISNSANPIGSYDTAFDIFSYGILMIHVFCGQWPEPCEPVRVDPNVNDHAHFLPLSEAERRTKYLQDIGHAHPLMNLILRCISNYTQQRPKTSNIIHQLNNRPSESQPLFTMKRSIHQLMSWSNDFVVLCIIFVCFVVIYALLSPANVGGRSTNGLRHPC